MDKTHDNNFNLPTQRTILFVKKPGYADAWFFNTLPPEEIKLEDIKS